MAPKLSIVVRFRDEHPAVITTMLSLLEDLEHCGLKDYEFLMVDNLSEDSAADVLEDKFRRWIKSGLLKVIRYRDKASTWCAINAGYAASTGDVLVVADAHISVRRGTLGLLVGGALEQGGIWHSAVQMWGDNDDTVNGYGYDLRLTERFWGNPCRHLPPGRKCGEAWKIPMAGACLYAVTRREVEAFGLYHPAFRSYGGGEPYLDLKWWLRGSAVWVHSGALCRHAFGLKAAWKEDKKGSKPHRNEVYTERGRTTHAPEPGEKYLAYSSGYVAQNSFDFAFNFSLAALMVGGGRWMEHVSKVLGGKQVHAVRKEVLNAASSALERVSSIDSAGGALCGVDRLLANPPWEHCAEHAQEKGIA